jgi:hypothetical protein
MSAWRREAGVYGAERIGWPAATVDPDGPWPLRRCPEISLYISSSLSTQVSDSERLSPL